ncbi:DNA-directed RNA polymerase I subunit rpa49 [Arthrobotrys musiformis]|uniref:DNA-directed RNA polymerase I subunit rpa49 n=1 Tax=Arthrobotrys musiformis TaxID=47236 RepID=A0AAV9VUX0_9PEZI
MASPERERKRKRDAHGQPRPVVPAQQSQVVKIHQKEAGSHPPILASIHGVELPTDLTFSAYSKKSRVSRHTPAGTKIEARETEYCLQAKTSRIEYDGRGEGEDGVSYYVGVYDPESGSVDVYPSPLVHVRRQVRRLKEKEIPVKASTGSLMDSRQALSAAFGNRTSKKALLDEQLNAINTTTLGSTGSSNVVSAISSAVDSATASLPTSESLRSGSGNSKYLPPVHADEEGVTVDTVYRVEEMVEKRVLDGCAEGVKEWEKSVRAGGEVESTISPHYVTSRIRGVIDSGTNVTKRLKILRYIEHMIQFHRLFINAFSNTIYRPKLYDAFISDDKAITSHLIDTFTDAKNQNKNDRQMSKTKLTKLYCWMMILCLKVEEDGRMDLFDLVQDLQIERREVEMAAREIGARVEGFKDGYLKMMGYGKEEAREHRLVALRLPLSFPKNKMLQVRKK